MLDYLKTVQPATGLVRSVAVVPPDGEVNLLWTVAADIGQEDFSGARLRTGDYPLTLVGAAGPERADAFVRACGEAVERAALLPTAALADDPTAPPLEAGASWSGDPFAYGAYAGLELATSSVRRVPAPAVDYPIPHADVAERFNVTPSGAAAGPTYAAAVAAATRELIERDAATIAWARQAQLPRLDLRALAGSDRRLAKLLAIADAAGLEATVAVVPTVGCVIGVVLDRVAGLAAAGIAVGDAAKALSEALQVRGALVGVARHHRGQDPPAAIASDVDRARFWTTPSALEAMDHWLAQLGPVTFERPAAAHATLPGTVVIDLTPRLPATIQALGWRAVKAFAPQLQPLPMSELADWRWNHARLAAPERDWGVQCGVPGGTVAACPHPFI